MNQTKIIKSVSLKGNNKRISIQLVEQNNEHFFIQATKTLIDRKKRQFIETNNLYSVETFAILTDIFSKFMDDREIKNKILHSELSKIKKFKGKSNF